MQRRLEYIYRLRNKGMSLKDACIKGSSQIMMAMLASSLTTICVFFPMFFLEGMMMEMFTDLVWVIILSLLCSFVVAVMFLPSIVATFKINPKPAKEIIIAKNQKPTFSQKVSLGWRKFMGCVDRIFDKTVRFCINKKWLTVVLALVLFVGSACLLFVNGFILMPSTDEGTISVSASLTTAGKTTANQKEDLGEPLYNQVKNVLGEDIEKCVISYDSGANILSGGVANVTVEIKLKDERSLTTNQASEKLYNAFQNFDDEHFADIEVATSSMTGSFLSNEVSVTLSVDAKATATETAYEVACGILDDFNVALENKFTGKMEEYGIRGLVYDQNKGVKIQKHNGRYASALRGEHSTSVVA